MVDKRRSSEYKELRGFIPKALTMEFKAACKKAGQNINDTLEEAVRDWIYKQEQSRNKQSHKVVPLVSSNFDRDDVSFSTLPTIAAAIETTLGNLDWGVKHLANETKISITILRKLLSGDRPDDEEIEQLAGCLIKLDGLVFDLEELTDMRLAEELKQRQLERLRRQQNRDKG